MSRGVEIILAGGKAVWMIDQVLQSDGGDFDVLLTRGGTQKIYRIEMPPDLRANIYLDPTTLSLWQQELYKENIANADGTARLQHLRNLAKRLGRTAAACGITKRAETFEEWISIHSKLLEGIRVRLTRHGELDLA